jgi:hypothetical protein
VPDKINAKILEEDHDSLDALFYKDGMPELPELSKVSDVPTSELSSIKVDLYRDDFTPFMPDSVECNQRTFNVFEVLGNFELDTSGSIKDREKVILQNNFLDYDGLLVNEKGYLINEVTGAIRSKYTYEDLFLPETGSLEDLGELPMPFKLEKFNFNPHRIMGCFYYDSKNQHKPIILKSKYNSSVDNHNRPVNQQGYLINGREDVIDNDGHVRFVKEQL